MCTHMLMLSFLLLLLLGPHARQTRAVNPKADVTYTTTLFGTQPTIKLDFSTY